MQVMQVRI